MKNPDNMKIQQLIYTLLFLILSAQVGGAATDSVALKAERLRKLYTLSVGDQNVNRECQEQFFYEFPDSFKELVALYGYENDTPSILYKYGVPHILELFNNLKVVEDTLYFQKIISISIGGHWEADAENYFQEGLRSKVVKNPKLVVCLLKKESDTAIESFWYFYFDGPHPQKEIPQELAVIKDIDADMYRLMQQALKKVQKEWSEY